MAQTMPTYFKDAKAKARWLSQNPAEDRSSEDISTSPSYQDQTRPRHSSGEPYDSDYIDTFNYYAEKHDRERKGLPTDPPQFNQTAGFTPASFSSDDNVKRRGTSDYSEGGFEQGASEFANGERGNIPLTLRRKFRDYSVPGGRIVYEYDFGDSEGFSHLMKTSQRPTTGGPQVGEAPPERPYDRKAAQTAGAVLSGAIMGAPHPANMLRGALSGLVGGVIGNYGETGEKDTNE